MCVFSPVGFKGNLSLLDIVFKHLFFPRGLEQMEEKVSGVKALRNMAMGCITYGDPILGWMNIHLPPILMFIRGTGV